MLDNGSLPIASLLLRKEISILVVDDDKFMRGLVARKLGEAGFSVFEADSGAGALDRVGQVDIHLIVLDILMPGMNGFEVLAHLQQKTKRQIPVVVLSNLGAPEDVEKARSLGAKEFLVKAAHTPEGIVAAVLRVLETSYIKK